MGAVAELIGLDKAALIARAEDLLAAGEAEAARMAARLAGVMAESGEDCPFSEGPLAQGWLVGRSPLPRRVPAGWRARKGSTQAAHTARDEEPGLDF